MKRRCAVGSRNAHMVGRPSNYPPRLGLREEVADDLRVRLAHLRRLWWWVICSVGMGALPALTLWLFDSSAHGFTQAVDRGYLLALSGPILGGAVMKLVLADKLESAIEGVLAGRMLAPSLPSVLILLAGVAGNASNLTPDLQEFATRTLSVGTVIFAWRSRKDIDRRLGLL